LRELDQGFQSQSREVGELAILDLHVHGLHGGLRPSRREIHLDPE